MAGRRTLVSGDVIAERYHLQDLVHERLGAATWRAHDSVLSRNVGLELLSSDDERAQHFLDAARGSTVVTDPRFLRVLDLITDEYGNHMVVREWARAFGLDAVLAQAPLPSWRAAAVVADVAEALANAHELGQYHRQLSPRHVLLKENGAVRIVGLGVATALAPLGSADDPNTNELERLDVLGLGRLLYACLVSRWPGGHVDTLRAAPTEHGRTLRPRQVRAGVDREIDAICDRILSPTPMHHAKPITSAAEVAHELRHALARLSPRDRTTTDTTRVPDVVRYDPVVEPLGPPPGLEPPRPRPKAFEPPPPTTLERSKAQARRLTKGERGLVLLGSIGVLVILLIIAFLAGRHGTDPIVEPTESATGQVSTLQIDQVLDFDPQGDRTENPDTVDLVRDGDPETGWTTQTYRSRADLGGLKDGVGLVLDLGATRQVDSVRLTLAGAPTSLQILTAPPGLDGPPESAANLSTAAEVLDAGTDVTVSLPSGTVTRYVVVWLTSLPSVDQDSYRGEIREIRVDGRS